MTLLQFWQWSVPALRARSIQGLLRHSNVKTTLGLYAHQVNASMLVAQDSMMRALQPGSQTVN